MQRYQGVDMNKVSYNMEDPDRKPVKMTNSLKVLEESRKQKAVKEVEDEFKNI